MDFRDALNTVTAEFTPQPWDYTDSAGATLTVIPAGLREAPGCAEVYVRITVDKTHGAEAAIPSRDLPAMIDALTSNRMWSFETIDDISCDLTPFGGGGMLLTLSADPDAVEEQPQIHIPEVQRLPLASALRRALDVARGWEA